jgi:hypothetical protein
MARYNLNANEASILTSWLFEEGGYLDNAIREDGQSARAALLATPALDVTNWIRTNTPNPMINVGDWNDTGMVWWMRASDGVNINRSQLPTETASWVAKLQEWDASIADAFVRVSQAARDGGNITITAEDGSTSQRPAGLQLVQQRSLFGKVLAVLQQ